jgi:hypothetical protein
MVLFSHSYTTKLQVNQSTRDGTADLLKGFAVLFMIQVHIMELFALPDVYNSLIGKISLFLGGPPCAPVFMAVMGYFMVSSSKSLGYFLKRGVVLFFGGILLNTARSANLLIRIINGEIQLDPWFYIFGADILTLAGLSLMLTGLLRMILKEKYWLYFIFAVIIVTITPVLNSTGTGQKPVSHFMAFLWGTNEWSYFPLFPWYSYVLTGYAFRLFLKQYPYISKLRIEQHYIYFIPLWIFLIFTITYSVGIAHNLSGPGGYYHHGILYFGWVILFMTSYLVVMKLVDLNYGNVPFIRGVRWIGKEVTLLYVIQWLIIGNIATIFFRTQNIFQITVWFAGVTLTTILTGLFYIRMRATKFPGVK